MSEVEEVALKARIMRLEIQLRAAQSLEMDAHNKANRMHRRAQRLEGMEARLERVKAGYVKSLIPMIYPDATGGEKRVEQTDYQVHVCVACRTPYTWINSQVYDLTGQVDLEAWEKAEKELHKATGPGGQC